jgi:hypothetical protein
MAKGKQLVSLGWSAEHVSQPYSSRSTSGDPAAPVSLITCQELEPTSCLPSAVSPTRTKARGYSTHTHVLSSNRGRGSHCADMQASGRLSREKAEAWVKVAKGRKAEGLSAPDLILLP